MSFIHGYWSKNVKGLENCQVNFNLNLFSLKVIIYIKSDHLCIKGRPTTLALTGELCIQTQDLYKQAPGMMVMKNWCQLFFQPQNSLVNKKDILKLSVWVANNALIMIAGLPVVIVKVGLNPRSGN